MYCVGRPCGSTHVPVTVRARPYRLDAALRRLARQLSSDSAASALAQTFDNHEITLNPRLNLFGKIAKSLILVYYTIVSLVRTKERSTRDGAGAAGGDRFLILAEETMVGGAADS